MLYYNNLDVYRRSYRTCWPRTWIVPTGQKYDFPWGGAKYKLKIEEWCPESIAAGW